MKGIQQIIFLALLCAPLTAAYLFGDRVALLQVAKDALLGGQPEHPGASLTITSDGVDYVFDLAERILNNEIMNLNIGDIYAAFDSGYVNISSLKLTAYNPPTMQKSLVPKNGVSCGIVNGGIDLIANWDGGIKLGALNISGIGSFEAKVRNLNVSLFFNVSITNDGRPILTNPKCLSDFGSMNVYIKGGFIGYTLNAFRSLLITTLKPILQTELCKIVVVFVRKEINGILAQFPPTVPIAKDISIKLALLQDPLITLSTLVTNHSARVLSTSSNSTPFEPRSLNSTPTTISNRMLTLRLSDYVINALLYQFYHSRFFGIEIDPGNFGKVSCSIVKGEICIGSIFAQLPEMYADDIAAKVHIAMQATEPPFAFFVQDRILIRGIGEIALNVYNSSNYFEKTFLNITTRIIAEVRHVHIDNSTLFSNLTLTNFSMDSSNNEAVAEDLWLSFVAFVRPLLQNTLNGILKSGWPLNFIDNLTFQNGTVEFRNRTMLVDADVFYNHTFKTGYLPSNSGNRNYYISSVFVLLCLLSTKLNY